MREVKPTSNIRLDHLKKITEEESDGVVRKFVSKKS